MMEIVSFKCNSRYDIDGTVKHEYYVTRIYSLLYADAI